jgi:uncharacterized protein
MASFGTYPASIGERKGSGSMTIEELRRDGCIIYECLSGSRAYGLDTAESDTDIKGVFVLPEDRFYGFDYVEQVSSEKNDIVFYELRKYLLLLAKNNPAAIELMFSPPETVLIRDPAIDRIDPACVASRLCRNSFAGYALGQVKRAKGLNKKIFNPAAGQRPSAIDFCYVLDGERSLPVERWLADRGLAAKGCGLTALPHIRDGYALFYRDDAAVEVDFGGLFRSDGKGETAPGSQDVCLSSVPKGMKPRTYLFFNRDDYSMRCKEHREYRTWEASRNDVRYKQTLSHGGGYDAKNMMHTIRLIRMAGEIARTGRPEVRRRDRDELLAIKSGAYRYEELLEMASREIRLVDEAFAASALPERPDSGMIEEWGIAIREAWYRRKRLGGE